MHNPIIGPWLRESKDEGRLEGQQEILMGQIAKRFGLDVPANLSKRLAGLGSEELRAISLRLLDVSSIDELFVG